MKILEEILEELEQRKQKVNNHGKLYEKQSKRYPVSEAVIATQKHIYHEIICLIKSKIGENMRN